MVRIESVEFDKVKKTVTVEARDIDREEWYALLLDDEQEEVLPVIKTKVYDLSDSKDRNRFATMLDYYTEAEGTPLQQMKQLEGKQVKFLA